MWHAPLVKSKTVLQFGKREFKIPADRLPKIVAAYNRQRITGV